MSRISEIAKEMKTWWGNDGSDIEVQNALDEIIRLDEATGRKTEPNNSKVSEIPTGSTSSKMEQVDKDINVRSKTEPQTDCAWR